MFFGCSALCLYGNLSLLLKVDLHGCSEFCGNIACIISDAKLIYGLEFRDNALVVLAAHFQKHKSQTAGCPWPGATGIRVEKPAKFDYPLSEGRSLNRGLDYKVFKTAGESQLIWLAVEEIELTILWAYHK